MIRRENLEIRIKDYYDDSKWHTPEELAVIKDVGIRVEQPVGRSVFREAQQRELADYQKYLSALQEGAQKRFEKKKALLKEKGINYETPQERALRDNVIL